MHAFICDMLCCLSDTENVFENKLRLPAPSAAISKTHTAPDDDDIVDNMPSILLAGMILICLFGIFSNFIV